MVELLTNICVMTLAAVVVGIGAVIIAAFIRIIINIFKGEYDDIIL